MGTPISTPNSKSYCKQRNQSDTRKRLAHQDKMVKNGKMDPGKSGTLRKFKEYSKNNPSQSYELQREIFMLQLLVELPIDVEDYEENEEEIAFWPRSFIHQVLAFREDCRLLCILFLQNCRNSQGPAEEC